MRLTETEKRFIKSFDLSEAQWAGLGRFNIKEMVDHSVEQRKIIEANMDATHGGYDFEEANLFMGLGGEDRAKMAKSLANMPLSVLMAAAYPELGLKMKATEVLAKSGTTGIQGAAYLIPDKIYQILFESAVETDVVDAISIQVIPAEQIPGATLKVDIEVDDSFTPYRYSSTGKMPNNEVSTCQATLDFSQPWGINFSIANDLIEDSQFDMMEFHLRQAGREFGEYASNEALTVLKTATDGDGTVNSGTAENDETYFDASSNTDILKAMKGNVADGFRSDRMVVTDEVMLHSLLTTAGAQYTEGTLYNDFIHNGFPTKLAGMDVIYSNVNTLTADKAQAPNVTILFSKNYSLLSGRKRWLRIENYSDPVRDLKGAVITARQDSITVYDDSVFVLTES